MTQSKRKCEICGNDALDKQRLCSKHLKQYGRQRKTDGRSVQEFIDFHTMDISDELKREDKITEQNADSKKTLYQAKVAQENSIKLKIENDRRSGELVERDVNKRAFYEIASNFVKSYEAMLNVIPYECNNKTSGEIAEIVEELYILY